MIARLLTRLRRWWSGSCPSCGSVMTAAEWDVWGVCETCAFATRLGGGEG